MKDKRVSKNKAPKILETSGPVVGLEPLLPLESLNLETDVLP